MWFDNIDAGNEPGLGELSAFVVDVRSFLRAVVQDNAFDFLWEGNGDLRELASETFRRDIADGAGLELDKAMGGELPRRALESHGLIGRPLRFKLLVVRSLDLQWHQIGPQFNVREWFKKMIAAIDAILGSLVEAFGAGGIIKEFKDAIASLA